MRRLLSIQYFLKWDDVQSETQLKTSLSSSNFSSDNIFARLISSANLGFYRGSIFACGLWSIRFVLLLENKKNQFCRSESQRQCMCLASEKSIMLGGRQKWCEEFVESHACAKHTSIYHVGAAGVEMMRGGGLPGQCMYASHVRCSSSVVFSSGPCTCCCSSSPSPVFPTPTHSPAKSLHFLNLTMQHPALHKTLRRYLQCNAPTTIQYSSENGQSVSGYVPFSELCDCMTSQLSVWSGKTSAENCQANITLLIVVPLYDLQLDHRIAFWISPHTFFTTFLARDRSSTK